MYGTAGPVIKTNECDDSLCACGCEGSRCRSFDAAGLCPILESRKPRSNSTVAFGCCTSTAQRAHARWQQFGAPLEALGLDYLYLLDAPLASPTTVSGSTHNSRARVSSPCPPQLEAWSNPGERCAWTLIVDLFAAFPQADWYALGDDDTLWIPQNLLQVLSTFSPQSKLFLGGLGNDKELQVSSAFWGGQTDISTHMIFGGAGIVLSHAVMMELQGGMLNCLSKMRQLYGGDERISLCVRDISKVAPHILPGFHQLDYFDPTHLFHLHPRSPVFSLHHLLEPSVINAIQYRGLTLDKLEEGIATDPFSFLQGSHCTLGSDMFLVAPGFQVYWFKHEVAYSMLMYFDTSSTQTSLTRLYQSHHHPLLKVAVSEDKHAFSWAHDRPQYCCKVTSIDPRQAALRIEVARDGGGCVVDPADGTKSVKTLLQHGG